MGDEDDVVIAAITAAELLVGVQLADERRRAFRGDFVASLLASIPIEPYDLEIAKAHAELLAHAARARRPRGAHHLLIAATALARSRIVVTAVAAGFDGLPGVAVRALPASG